MAGYGLKAFLIAQSLNQIEKAYGPNNAILDNCHVRVSFATNDERTAKRVSDALGRDVVRVTAGKDPDEKLLTWYRQYSITNLRPFVYQVNARWYAFGPHAFQLEMAAKVARGVSLWDGDLTAAGPHSSDKSGVRIDAGAR